ncbi:hypothetical protein [Rhodopila sp.]|uniref:hypothetical protein n=1 Tax=Rhodopila sp. TaxID=2480087 RepID=UPI003D0D9994
MKCYLVLFMLTFSVAAIAGVREGGASEAGVTAEGVTAGRAIGTALPLPPLPPDDVPVTEIAPVPDRDVAAPIAPPSEQPSLNVKMYRSKSYDPSLGFTPGSRYQSSEDRKAIQTPGLSLSVPLR